MTLEELGFPMEASTEDIAGAIVEQFGAELVSAVWNDVFAVEGAPIDDEAALIANAQAAFAEEDPAEVAYLAQVLFALIHEREDAVAALLDALSGEPSAEAPEAPAEPPAVAQEVLSKVKARSAARKRQPVAGKPNRVEQELAQLRRTVQKLVTSNEGLSPALPQNGKKDTPVIRYTDLKYDHLTPLQMAYGAMLMDNAVSIGVPHAQRASENYVRALAHKVEVVARKDERLQRAFLRAGIPTIRANEIVNSGSQGATWMGTFFSDQVVERIRTRRVFEVLRAAGLIEVEVPQGDTNFKALAEGSDPTVYYPGESTAMSGGYPTPTLTQTNPNLTLKTVAVSKLGVRIVVSGEMVEDAMVPILPFITSSMENSMAAAIEYVMILGDTETGGTGNINSDDDAPASTARYLAFDGFAKLGLVTNTANKRDGSTLAIDDYNETRALLGVNGISPQNVVYLVDTSTYYKTLPLNEVETVDVFGSGATVVTGSLNTVYGSPLLASDQIGLAGADGQIETTTVSNNAKGRIIAVAAPRWVVGIKRQITPEIQRWAGADATDIVMFARLGMTYMDTDAAAVSYNLTV